jgi:histidyl-tRNA synthetase
MPKSKKNLKQKKGKIGKSREAGAQKNLDKTAEIAMYYGFIPHSCKIPVTKDDISKAKCYLEDIPDQKSVWRNYAICPESKIAILRTYTEKNLASSLNPTYIYFERIVGDKTNKNKDPNEKSLGLEILGTGKSIAEAILIQTSIEILKEAGYPETIVELNSVGDKDSVARFNREFVNYCKKNGENFHEPCQQILKNSPFKTLECKDEKCREIMSRAPKSISFLSESSREHFKEVLEYLEMLGIPYRINDWLIGSRSFTTQTVFGIKNLADQNIFAEPLAIGARYNGLAKKIGFKKDMPAIGVSLQFKWNSKTESSKCAKIKKPKFYFIQLGFEAKLKSLKVVEMLRQAKMPVYQSLSRDKMASQIGMAENMEIPYTIIMGQKEAFEDSLIVRNMNTRAQETVKIGELSEYLKKIK